MEIAENVYVMSEMTWELWEMKLYEKASSVSNPLKYIELMSMIDVLIDNALPNFVIEVYDKSEDDYIKNNEDEYWWDL
jgi:hypothetical protein